MMRLALLSLLATSASASVLSLTDANFAEKTAGKTVFIKFFAPWCGHCKALAPDWEKLAAEWEGHKVGLVAEVDCDDEQELCGRFNIEGFPTLMHGDPSGDLDNYEGGRSFEDLQEFAKENISKPVCSVTNQDACDKATKKKIAELNKKSIDDLKASIKDVDAKVKEAEGDFEAKLMELQDQYEKMEKAFQGDVKKLKEEADYKFTRAVLLNKGGVLEEEEDDYGDMDEHDEF